MTRRRKGSPAEDLFDLVAMIPWWAGAALAIVAYAVLHHVATQQVAAVTAANQLGAAVTGMLWKSLASIGQYLLPAICFFAALASALGRRRRQSLLSDVTSSNAANALDNMSWREFEVLVGEAFRLQGYVVTETGGGGADGGVDLVLRRDRETHLVQCKQWKAFKVGVTVVRELYGVMAVRGAAGGFIVTSGRFSREATEFADGRNVKLLEGKALLALIKQAQAARARTSPKAVAPKPDAPRPTAAAPPNADSALGCPKCGANMVRRTAKRGSSAGNEFWGCRTYPDCRGIRPIG